VDATDINIKPRYVKHPENLFFARAGGLDFPAVPVSPSAYEKRPRMGARFFSITDKTAI
jgi:hypothetical protein